MDKMNHFFFYFFLPPSFSDFFKKKGFDATHVIDYFLLKNYPPAVLLLQLGISKIANCLFLWKIIWIRFVSYLQKI